MKEDYVFLFLFLYNVFMVLIENTKVYNLVDALRGMRNPKNSWTRNDSTTICSVEDGHIIDAKIGPNDAQLAQTLIKGGTEHRKFLRQIFVSADFTMPNYLTNEFDTYKICTTRNSCSIQHKGSSRDFVKEDFSFDNMENEDIETVLNIVNKYRRKFVETKNYDDFREMRQFLGMNYNYKFTWTGNYEVLLNMYKQRRFHKLKEWHTICDWIKTLPGMETFIF